MRGQTSKESSYFLVILEKRLKERFESVDMEDTRILCEDTIIETSEPSDAPQVATDNPEGSSDIPKASESSEPPKTESNPEKPPVAPAKKEKPKRVKVNVQVSEENAENEEKSEVQGDMNTLFILDLIRQRREKTMRKKKDDHINELAMKKKEQMMEARMGRRVLMRPAYGGFAGVNAILAGSKCNSPAPSRRRTPKPEMRDPQVDIPPPERTDLLIMGIIRDKREEKFHEAHHVSNHVLKKIELKRKLDRIVLAIFDDENNGLLDFSRSNRNKPACRVMIDGWPSSVTERSILLSSRTWKNMI